MQVPLSSAIEQVREQLRIAALEGADNEIIFIPETIEIEFGVVFTAEATGGGGFKILALVDLSTEAKASRESEHRIRLSLAVVGKDLERLRVKSDVVPKSLP